MLLTDQLVLLITQSAREVDQVVARPIFQHLVVIVQKFGQPSFGRIFQLLQMFFLCLPARIFWVYTIISIIARLLSWIRLCLFILEILSLDHGHYLLQNLRGKCLYHFLLLRSHFILIEGLVWFLTLLPFALSINCCCLVYYLFAHHRALLNIQWSAHKPLRIGLLAVARSYGVSARCHVVIGLVVVILIAATVIMAFVDSLHGGHQIRRWYVCIIPDLSLVLHWIC